MLDAGLAGGTDALAHADLLAEALHGQDGGVSRHADGEHDAGDARKGEAEQPECGERRQDAQIDDGEHEHGTRRDEAEALVEEQEVQHDQRKADQHDDEAGEQSILSARRAHHLAGGELEVHRERAALQHGLERLRLICGVVACDGDVAIRDDGLHCRRALHVVVQEDDDLALRDHQIARGLGERLRCRLIQIQIHRIVGARLACAVHRHALKAVTREHGGVRAGVDLQLLALLSGEGIAEVILDGGVVTIVAVLDVLHHCIIGERIQAREGQLTRGADGLQCLLSIFQAWDLHEDLVGALHLHRGLRGTQGVHAVLDDRASLLHILGRDLLALIRVRGQHHGQAAADVQALRDLVLRGREQDDRADDEQGREDQKPDVAAVLRPHRLLLRTFECHMTHAPYIAVRFKQ